MSERPISEAKKDGTEYLIWDGGEWQIAAWAENAGYDDSVFPAQKRSGWLIRPQTDDDYEWHCVQNPVCFLKMPDAPKKQV